MSEQGSRRRANEWAAQMLNCSGVNMNRQIGNDRFLYLGSVLLPVAVSKQLSLFLNKAFTNHHRPLLQVLG